jgi:hypothetical protein
VNGDTTQKEFQIYSWSKEIEDLVKIPWERGKPVGESETPVLGELNPPKGSKIPRRNQEIVKWGLGVTFMIELERERVKRSEGVRRSNSVRVKEPTRTG